MPAVKLADLVIRVERAGQREADLALLSTYDALSRTSGLRPGVGHRRESEAVLVEERRLLRVAHPELEVVPP